MLPILRILWNEYKTIRPRGRINEPDEAMTDPDQVRAYVKAYEWGGPTSALQLHHLRQLARLIRPGDTVVDLACGPGALLMELATLYPDTEFIGVDLSSAMLRHLEQEAKRRGLGNIRVLHEDMREIPSLGRGVADLVVTTSSLHHLPDEESLRKVFRRARTLLKPDGGVYMFDFGLLKSERAMEHFVAEVARLAPPLTVQDYRASLKAMFPIPLIMKMAQDELPAAVEAYRSRCLDFFFFLQSSPRTEPAAAVSAKLDAIARSLPPTMRLEHAMLRFFRRRARRRAETPDALADVGLDGEIVQGSTS